MNLVTEVLPSLRENSPYLDPSWDENPKGRAHSFLTALRAKPSFTPRPCCVCGKPNAHGHHEDYTKFLEVVWLCRKHHAERHHELWKLRKDSMPKNLKPMRFRTTISLPKALLKKGMTRALTIRPYTFSNYVATLIEKDAEKAERAAAK